MPSPKLTIHHHQRPDVALIRLTGELDERTAPQLARAARAPLAQPRPEIVVDLCRVWRIDSTGVAVLLNLQRRVTRRRGRLALACADEPLPSMLRLRRLEEDFALYPTLGEALAAGGRPGDAVAAGA